MPDGTDEATDEMSSERMLIDSFAFSAVDL